MNKLYLFLLYFGMITAFSPAFLEEIFTLGTLQKIINFGFAIMFFGMAGYLKMTSFTQQDGKFVYYMSRIFIWLIWMISLICGIGIFACPVTMRYIAIGMYVLDCVFFLIFSWIDDRRTWKKPA